MLPNMLGTFKSDVSGHVCVVPSKESFSTIDKTLETTSIENLIGERVSTCQSKAKEFLVCPTRANNRQHFCFNLYTFFLGNPSS